MPPQTVGPSRYFGHALVLILAILIAFAGNLGRSTGDWQSLALDRAVELPSAFAHSNDQTQEDVLLKPPAPQTQLVNRPRLGSLIHRVQEGDTVGTIADKYEISVPTVLWANGLTEDDVLMPGRQLVILPVSGVLHTIQLGEQVADIARRYQSDAQAIIEFNQITDPEHIVANDVIVVPGGRREERPRPVPAARSDTRPGAEDAPTAASIAASTGTSQVLQPSSYTVASGDNLSGIAKRFGVSVETLMWANGLQDNPEQINEGQTLTILPVSGALHKVADGDSLFAIADRYGVDSAQIVSANALASADALSVGQQLIIPGSKLATAEELAAQARQAAAETAAAQARLANSLKYTVQSGESLGAIAERYSVDVSSIVAANNLSSADSVAAGQELLLPGARAIAVAAPPAAAPKPVSVAAAPAPKPAAAPAAPAPAAPAPAPAAKPAAQPPAPPPAASGDGSRIVSIASQYLGSRYYWGGHSPSTGFDCSGFVWYVYQQAGIRIPLHDLWGQLQAGPRISQANLQPGDIVFFQNTYTRGMSHDGIYIGGGRFINAEDYGKGVRVANLNDSYWSSRYFGASRPW